MGINEDGVVIVHGGGVYGNKKETIERWIKNFRNMPEAI